MQHKRHTAKHNSPRNEQRWTYVSDWDIELNAAAKLTGFDGGFLAWIKIKRNISSVFIYVEFDCRIKFRNESLFSVDLSSCMCIHVKWMNWIQKTLTCFKHRDRCSKQMVGERCMAFVTNCDGNCLWEMSMPKYKRIRKQVELNGCAEWIE